VFTGLFIPFFAGYGLSEYVGYQFGRERLRGRMRLVYALYLFGAAAAYLFLGWGISRLGIAAMIALALAGVALAAAILSRGGFRAAAGAAALGITDRDSRRTSSHGRALRQVGYPSELPS
jgi:hypothetical protein